MKKFLFFGLAVAATGMFALSPEAAQSASARRADPATSAGRSLAAPFGAMEYSFLDLDAARGVVKPVGRMCCSGAGGDSCCTKVRVVLQEDKKKAGEKKAGEDALAKGNAARKALVDQQKALAKDGVWDCCIEPGCVFCQTAADGCPCEANLKKGSAVCPECWGGWQAGLGQVKGIDPNRVPIPSKDTLKKLYDMKAKNLEKAGK
jgi:hypothetical protein